MGSDADFAPSTPRASLVVLPASKDSISSGLGIEFIAEAHNSLANFLLPFLERRDRMFQNKPVQMSEEKALTENKMVQQPVVAFSR